MPVAPLRLCASSGCRERVPSGNCAKHRRQREQWRGTSADRGYDHHWARFRLHFVFLLAERGIPPVCGASLPTGPDVARYSRCKAERIENGAGLHLHHEPALTDLERAAAIAGDRRAVDDPDRCGFLCRACHAARGLDERR